MASDAVNYKACDKYLCFERENKGWCRVQLGMKITVYDPGWGSKDRTPAMAASKAAKVQSWDSLNPWVMRELSW